ncbi:hypothetical protein BDB00DRAFT_872357 [Zychaea mexicana]|uniref:uncharacterized protein n=1 Tax=Zychaea mexicana TaxID=64656 RepID=UPI0022FDB3F0|nr:uncharacterized protein BDB00DRAFT_872357 [Zychaea mexicana]KAI9493471.1 hypothetical protein BDB00DRAFT_872357 [Zychaea mexicana]
MHMEHQLRLLDLNDTSDPEVVNAAHILISMKHGRYSLSRPRDNINNTISKHNRDYIANTPTIPSIDYVTCGRLRLIPVGSYCYYSSSSSSTTTKRSQQSVTARVELPRTISRNCHNCSTLYSYPDDDVCKGDEKHWHGHRRIYKRSFVPWQREEREPEDDNSQHV